ncbi:tyrosine-protein phosphatase [Kitasatospora sp. NPDC056446]|uniref:tyrosine-protein phosphatase n=1 Tax=Kitasatospora sp. NPDC056446 TaxID=3345819 RepID=UPI0036CCC63B
MSAPSSREPSREPAGAPAAGPIGEPAGASAGELSGRPPGSAAGTRTIALPGLPNVRDSGGLSGPRGTRLRRGVLLRGPAPSPGTAPALDALGVRTVVDLRQQAEREVVDGPGHTRARVLRRPVWGDMSGIRGTTRPAQSAYLANYRSMLEIAAPVAVEVVELLARAGTAPVYVCCTVGKDRTGVVCALVLRGLGVRLADVTNDYALTGRAYRALRPGDPRPEWSYQGSLDELRARTASPAVTMRALLDGIEREHGSVGAFLEGHGLSPGTRRDAGERVFEPRVFGSRVLEPRPAGARPFDQCVPQERTRPCP